MIWSELTDQQKQILYPFAKDLNTEYDAQRSNSVEKVRLWYEDREQYYSIVKKYPEEKLFRDKEKVKVAPVKSVNSEKKSGQIGLF